MVRRFGVEPQAGFESKNGRCRIIGRIREYREEPPMKKFRVLAVALPLLMTAASAWAGDSEDCRNAKALLKSNPAKAVAACTRVAERGDATAETEVGFMYATGQGVPTDHQEAVKWFRKAAAQGDAHAQRDLGLAYFRGEGVAQDYKEAANWFRKSAEQGLALAQSELGVMYFHGQGVQQDFKEAVMWFRKAAEQGLAGAENNLGGMYGIGQGVARDDTKAANWFFKSAQQGNADGQYNFGLLLFRGAAWRKTMSRPTCGLRLQHRTTRRESSATTRLRTATTLRPS